MKTHKGLNQLSLHIQFLDLAELVISYQISTPQSTPTGKPKPKGTPQIPEPLHRPSKGQTGTQPIPQTHTGVGGPPAPQDGIVNPPVLQPQHNTLNAAGSFDPWNL